jgi:hypothetical protein
METIRINSRLTNEEKETILIYDSVDKKWRVDTVVSKHMNKFKKQEWLQLAEYVYDDGTVCGGVFEAPDKAVTFRNPNKKRVMSEEQMKNLHRNDDEDEENEDDD